MHWSCGVNFIALVYAAYVFLVYWIVSIKTYIVILRPEMHDLSSQHLD